MNEYDIIRLILGLDKSCWSDMVVRKNYSEELKALRKYKRGVENEL